MHKFYSVLISLVLMLSCASSVMAAAVTTEVRKPYGTLVVDNTFAGDAQAISGGAVLYGVIVTGTSAGDSATLYNNDDGSGTSLIAPIRTDTNNQTKLLYFDKGINISSNDGDIYIDVTDADVEVTLLYN